MSEINAIFQNGVFKPLENVGLPENQQVRLSFQTIETNDARVWFAEVQELRQRIIAQRGYFPDSTLSIAEDRRR